MDKAFLEQMKKKVELELRNKEAEVVEHWKEELNRIIHKNTESLSALQVDLKAVIGKMENRLKIVKKSSGY